MRRKNTRTHYRLQRKCNQRANMRLPLVEWGMTEADCLQYCYDREYDWDGLYTKMKRVSCWCCPLQFLPELRALYREFPDLWAQLRRWDDMTWRPFRADYSVKELEQRFDFEDEWLKAGKSSEQKSSMLAFTSVWDVPPRQCNLHNSRRSYLCSI